jgi:transposase-like protein
MNQPIPDKPHGNWRTYRIDKCRCPECRRYANRSSVESRLRKLRGQPTYMTRDVVVAHVEQLMASGMTMTDIARVAGLRSANALRAAMRNPEQRIRMPYGQAILNVKPQIVPDSFGRLSARGAQRRLRALARMGYNCATIAEATGLSYSFLSEVRSGKRSTIAAQCHVRLAEFYDQHHMIHGPNHKTASNAARSKWMPPLAWEDIDNDTTKTAWANVGHNSSRIRAL